MGGESKEEVKSKSLRLWAQSSHYKTSIHSLNSFQKPGGGGTLASGR